MKKQLILLVALAALCACQPKPAPKVGTAMRDTINGVPCYVYVPENYAARAEKEEFPVLYLHHGMYGCEDDWIEQGFLLQWMDSLLACQAVKEMVIIMPDNCPRKLIPEVERANAMSGEWERNFPQFMAETKKKYNVSEDPDLRAIAGLSMGGFHSMHVSHHLHGQFKYVGLFSPAIRCPEPNEIYDCWEEEVRLQMEDNPVYWIAIGKEDFLYGFVKDYREWLDENHFTYTYYESEGGHTWPNWQDYICRFLPLLFK